MSYRANENKAYQLSKADPEKAYKDKDVFVKNLGWVLSQTRTGVTACRLIDNDTVEVLFGEEGIPIDIAADSYTAIIMDVCKSII